jgi:hypothetical protein
MAVPHWLIRLTIFLAAGAFIVFAFRQGQQIKPDRNKRADDWQTGGNSGVPPPEI